MATHRRGVWRTMVVAGSVYFLMKRRKNCWRVAHKDIVENLVTCRLGCYGTSKQLCHPHCSTFHIKCTVDILSSDEVSSLSLQSWTAEKVLFWVGYHSQQLQDSAL